MYTISPKVIVNCEEYSASERRHAEKTRRERQVEKAREKREISRRWS